MDLEEKERQLIQEIEFFNKNVEWWNAECMRVSNAVAKLEKEDYLGLRQEEKDKLVAQLSYLIGKTRTEQKTAQEIDRKLYKLSLYKELHDIQGDFKIGKSKKKR